MVTKKKQKTVGEKLKENPWIFTTLILGILLLISIIGSFSSKISGENAGKAFVDFINAQGSDIEYVSSKPLGEGLYEITVLSEGKEFEAYVTQDGKYFVQILAPLTTEESKKERENTQKIPKANTPKVELYIWGYCPYGVQAQGPFTEVGKLLNNYATFKVVLFHDGHGEYENQQNKIQECIQKHEPERYLNYSEKFVNEIYSKCGSTKTIECDKSESIRVMNEVGINSSKIFECVDSEGDSLFTEDRSKASQMSISGSPTLVINGQKIQVSRTAEAYKTAICQAFNNAPEECKEVLSSETQTSTSGAQC